MTPRVIISQLTTQYVKIYGVYRYKTEISTISRYWPGLRWISRCRHVSRLTAKSYPVWTMNIKELYCYRSFGNWHRAYILKKSLHGNITPACKNGFQSNWRPLNRWVENTITFSTRTTKFTIYSLLSTNHACASFNTPRCINCPFCYLFVIIITSQIYTKHSNVSSINNDSTYQLPQSET